MGFFSEAKKVAQLIENSKGATVLVLLNGPLGAGKTTFVKEVLSELGCDAAKVQSPTFLKLLEYRARNELYLHIDAYRIAESEDVAKLSLESYENVRAVFVEWPETFLDYLKQHPVLVKRLGVGLVLTIEIDESHSLKILSETPSL